MPLYGGLPVILLKFDWQEWLRRKQEENVTHSYVWNNMGFNAINPQTTDYVLGKIEIFPQFNDDVTFRNFTIFHQWMAAKYGSLPGRYGCGVGASHLRRLRSWFFSVSSEWPLYLSASYSWQGMLRTFVNPKKQKLTFFNN